MPCEAHREETSLQARASRKYFKQLMSLLSPTRAMIYFCPTGSLLSSVPSTGWRGLWADCVDAETELGLGWQHMFLSTFFMARLICSTGRQVLECLRLNIYLLIPGIP